MPKLNKNDFKPSDFNATRNNANTGGCHGSCHCNGTCHGHDGEPCVMGVSVMIRQSLNVERVLEKLHELQESASSLYNDVTGMIEQMESELEDCDCDDDED